MSITSVRLQPDVQEGLEGIAQKLQRSKSWLINQAVREYIDRTEAGAARWTATLDALESLAAGRVVEEEAVHDWLRTWGTAEEMPAPKSVA